MRSSAQYSLVRYIPDLARGEALNIGVLTWTEDDYRLRIDGEAVKRAAYHSPHSSSDMLRSIELSLKAAIGKPFSPERVKSLLEAQRGYPLCLTEPRHVSLDPSKRDPLTDAQDRLAGRLVRPPRPRPIIHRSLLNEVEKRLRPLIRENRIVKNHIFESSRTGIPREVSFYANSGTNVALDVLRVALQKPRDIRIRVDAEAFKIEDIIAKNNIRFLVLCEPLQTEHAEQVNREVQCVLGSVGAEVIRDVDRAVSAMVFAGTP